MIGLEELVVRTYNVFFGASVLFLVAVGLNIIYGVMKIVNLAHPSLFMFGSYTVAGLIMSAVVNVFGSSIAPLLLLPPIFAAIVVVIVSLALYPFFQFSSGKGDEVQLLITYGLLLIFEDIFRLVWGSAPLRASQPFELAGIFRIGQYIVPLYNAYVIAFAFGVAVLLWYFLFKTKLGMVIRASSMDLEMASALGTDAKMVLLLTVALAGFLAGLGGGLFIPSTSAMLGMSVELLVLAFVVVVIGGLGSFFGSLIGALIVSFLRTITLIFIPELELALLYIVAFAVLLLKPEGLGGGRKW
ncbi:MAG: branched-chain amino acid ABC transporter permease [Candidatus Caldarchaeum sp.]|nr:branched-chain amino acid ABC transporter permease [Candidatus Caldarchaeum sp.]MDW8435091.1 branched-chain amino acid ABC transporter permease [Candidatus Caldarchaeum sp.]